ncbi:MAG TPA: RloB family protein [Pyrinomonadaceae bacterium]|nr:RloB family protein [Pyrinomonadaceae bacterium]
MAKRAKFRLRARPLQRRRPSLDPRPRILVVCEGRITEPQYFDAFRREEENRLVDVRIDSEGGAPKTLVERAANRKKESEEEARRARDENLKYDEVWCVFDVDEHPRLPDARQQARDNGINLAISNPCFELWLLLHFREQNAHIERKAVATLLKKHIRNYRKHVSFETLRDGYLEAVQRAQQLDRRHADVGTEGDNPSTNVYILTECIREFGRKFRSHS